MVEDMADQVDMDGILEMVDEDLVDLIPWPITGVGFTAIWPMTVPMPGHNRWVVEALALPQKVRLNLGSQAQGEDVAMVGKFVLGV